MKIAVGALRQTIRFTLDLADDHDVESTGRLYIEPAGADLVDEPIVGEVIIYTLDRERLLGMLAAARAGAPDDDLILALDAAALASDDDDEDEDEDEDDDDDGR